MSPFSQTRSRRLTPWTESSLSVLRIVTALVFLEHGSQKLLGFPAGPRAFAEPFTLIWWAGCVELVTGLLLVFGLFTRSAAFLASGTMAAAYWSAHAPRDVFPAINDGDPAILFCFIFLHLALVGPGPWSLDAARNKLRPTAHVMP